MSVNRLEFDTLAGRVAELEETVEDLTKAKAKRREYMREYMRKRRAKEKKPTRTGD